MIAIGIMLGVVAILTGFALRPATVVGVDGGSLARAVGKEGNCKDLDDGLWRCNLSAGAASSGSESLFMVKTRFLGCWDAWSANKPRKTAPKGEPDKSGCITIAEML
jgi:hypothetical protein